MAVPEPSSGRWHQIPALWKSTGFVVATAEAGTLIRDAALGASGYKPDILVRQMCEVEGWLLPVIGRARAVPRPVGSRQVAVVKDPCCVGRSTKGLPPNARAFSHLNPLSPHRICNQNWKSDSDCSSLFAHRMERLAFGIRACLTPTLAERSRKSLPVWQALYVQRWRVL